jgi:hypothetical protein
MRDARSIRSATALRALNAALLVGLGASLAVVAPRMRARFAPRQPPPPAVTSVATSPPARAAIEPLRRHELSVQPPVRGGDSVTRVIANNKGILQNCYERALLRDDSIGRIKTTIRLTVGLSGRVLDVKIDAAPRLRTFEPCLRESLSRWVFPADRERYGVEFTFIASSS